MTYYSQVFNKLTIGLMKRKLLLLISFLLFSYVKGDMIPPQAYISELHFNSPYSWELEMGFNYADLDNEIDSIQILSSSDIASINISSIKTIKGPDWLDFFYIAVISDTNLSKPLSINPDGDLVKLITYSWGESHSDKVVFGNYTGSYLQCFDLTKSISYLEYNVNSFCINSVPSIGLPNDTTGSLGTFSGKIYDLSGDTITNANLYIPELSNNFIKIDLNGSFNIRTLAMNYNFDKIKVYFPNTVIKTYKVEPFDFCLEPESAYHHNIVTTSLVSVISGIEVPESDFSNVTVFPNPFKTQTSFYFNLKNEKYLHLKEINLLIFSAEGKKWADIKIPSTLSKYDWLPKQTIPSGVLMYNLQTDNKIIARGKFIKE